MDPVDRERDVDQWLESALGQYGKAEPRAGLESRVLANLQGERNRRAAQRRWWWTVGTAVVAAAIVAMVWIGERGRERSPGSTVRIATTDQEDARASRQQIHQAQTTHPSEAKRHRAGTRPIRDLEVVQAPKLEQFPSPAPLNDQEKMLARYVEEFPQRAALVARAQTELRKRDELEMAAPWPTNTDSTGLEQEE